MGRQRKGNRKNRSKRTRKRNTRRKPRTFGNIYFG